MYMHISINISVCNHLYFKLNMSSYTDVSNSDPLLHASLLLLPLACLLLSTHTVRNLLLTFSHPFNCSIPVYTYSHFRIINLYAHRKYLYQPEYSSYIEFLCLFSLTDSIHFQSDLGQHFIPLTPSVRLFHIFVIYLNFCHNLHSHQWPWPPKRFLNILYALRFTLCAVKFSGFWQMLNVFYSPVQYHKE